MVQMSDGRLASMAIDDEHLAAGVLKRWIWTALSGAGLTVAIAFIWWVTRGA
jgi:hypothetical protein